MSQFILTLANKLNHKDLYFDIFNTNIAKKWTIEVSKNYSICNNDRFVNWPNSKKDSNYYVTELNKQLKIVDEYAPTVVPFFFNIEQVNQSLLNILHKLFEDLIGTVDNPTEFYKNSPQEVQKAILRFNIMIHEFESYVKNIAMNKIHPDSKLVVVFGERNRYELIDEDYDHFTLKSVFGTVYINYCELGKPILDVLRDQDEHIGDSNIRPLQYYSADLQIQFSPTMGEDEFNRTMQWVKMQYDKRKEFFESLGLFYDKKLSLGLIPVASINRNDSGFLNMTDFEIISSLSEFNIVTKTEIRESITVLYR